MAGYIGQSPGIGQTQYFAYTCTAGQTSFSGPDNNGYVLNYNVGFVDVYLNGRRLTPTLDYTATDGSSLTLLAATSASDIVFVTALSAFSIANWITNSVNYVYIATAGQTTFTGVDSNSQTLSYVAGTIVVSVNGVILPQSDYAALDGLAVTLGSGVNAGDVVQIFSLRTINPVSISNWITNNLTNLVTYTYIATAGQTTFSGSAYSGGTLAYKAGCIQVTVNGLLLTPADYTATNGTSVVLNVGVNLDDTVVIWVYGNTTVAGVYTQAQSDSRYLINPTQTILTSGSGTYTVPSGVRWLRVRMAGGGGGGAGGGAGAGGGSGSNGGITTFGSSFLTCNYGAGAAGGSTTGIGGSASIGAGASGVAFTGGNSQSSGILNVTGYVSGTTGGSNAFGGAGYGGNVDVGPGAAIPNTGCGGGGGSATYNGGQVYSGAGGGAGGYIDCIITNLAASYSYAVGAGGNGGTAGTSGKAGAAGGSGIIIIEEHYT